MKKSPSRPGDENSSGKGEIVPAPPRKKTAIAKLVLHEQALNSYSDIIDAEEALLASILDEDVPQEKD